MDVNIDNDSVSWYIKYYSHDSYIIIHNGVNMYLDDETKSLDEFVYLMESLNRFLNNNEDKFIYGSERFNKTKSAKK